MLELKIELKHKLHLRWITRLGEAKPESAWTPSIDKAPVLKKFGLNCERVLT